MATAKKPNQMTMNLNILEVVLGVGRKMARNAQGRKRLAAVAEHLGKAREQLKAGNETESLSEAKLGLEKAFAFTETLPENLGFAFAEKLLELGQRLKITNP